MAERMARRPARLTHAGGVEPPRQPAPRFAFRLAALGSVALALFAVLLLRLWSLQVLSPSQYLQAARENEQRVVRVEGPRGPIVDRNGTVLVSNAATTAIALWPAELPRDPRTRAAELRRLARNIDVPLAVLARAAASPPDPVTPVVVKESAREDEVVYLAERQLEFPGIRVSQTYIRRYPYRTLAAQLLGYTGEISAAQLKQHRRSESYRPGDLIGQSGVEAAYDRYLRGSDGLAAVRVDSLGRPHGGLRLRRAPQVGNALRLTLDLRLQQAAERALRFGIATARANKNWYADGGAVVALDPRDGAILALASNPTYKPSVFAGHADAKKLAPLVDARAAKQANYPALNRATQGLYPPGSTFKPVTALAAMQERLVAPYDPLPCTPTFAVDGQVFRNWNPALDERMDLPTALAASCDTYFYRLGDAFYRLPAARGQPLQRWAAQFGFGTPTAIDIGGDERGLLPTIAWRRRTYTRATDPCCWQVDRLWKPGDSIQLAIGQKDLLVTPLQMARFYALIANGGKLVTPYVAADVEQPGNTGASGRVLDRFAPPPPKATNVDPAALAVVRVGLYQATHARLGTSSGIFGHFPIPIAGKTGTAEKVVEIAGRAKLLSQSWWCGYGPAEQATLVVCAVIENGGFGAEAAAPAALKVFQQYFGIRSVRQSYVASD